MKKTACAGRRQIVLGHVGRGELEEQLLRATQEHRSGAESRMNQKRVTASVLVHTNPAGGSTLGAIFPRHVAREHPTCGNVGLYSFTGWYWSRGVGHYRALVTDPKRVVVLRFECRVVVVSSDRPEEFVRAIETR